MESYFRFRERRLLSAGEIADVILVAVLARASGTAEAGFAILEAGRAAMLIL